MKELKNLIEKFEGDIDYYKSSKFNETQLRNEFLDVFLAMLGWDVTNTKGQKTNEREVLVEESLSNHLLESTKKPDYTFRLFSERKFFLEAKKPYVSILNNSDVAFQTKRYGWSANLKISIASNFEYLLIYDCTKKPNISDDPRKGLVAKYHFKEYMSKFSEIETLIGRDSVYSGKYDKYWSKIEDSVTKNSVDDQFLGDINRWRMLLAEEIVKSEDTISEQELNDKVQSYLNALVFLRVCEDRNIEKYKSLLDSIDKDNVEKLTRKLKEADKKYNSGLFELDLTEEVIKNINSAFWNIVKEIYYPNTTYSFSVMSSDILGNIYEIYLSQKLCIIGDRIELRFKEDHLDRDVVTTPTYVVREILKQTLVNKLSKNEGNLNEFSIADISCGSGAFLLEAYQMVHDHLVDYYLKNSKDRLVHKGVNSYKLSFKEKREILIHTIHGIDIDYNAVQAAKFGLLLKLLEDENEALLEGMNSILPRLDENIIWSNSLIEEKDLAQYEDALNPIDRLKKFDVIVGNPPYMKTEDMINLLPKDEFNIYKKKYQSAYKQFDKYYLFIEQGIEMLKDDGILGYIVPSKFTRIGSGKNLRKLLSKRNLLTHFTSFGANQVFSSRTTYTSIIVLDKGNTNSSFEFVEVRDIDLWKTRNIESETTNEIPQSRLKENDNWVLMPSDLDKLYQNIISNSIELSNLIGKENIFNGIQTSANDVYVIDDWIDHGEHVTFSKDGKTYNIEKSLVKPFYLQKNSSDSLDTYEYLRPNKLVIYPYEIINEQAKLISLDRLKTEFVGTYEYLMDYKDRLESRNISPKPTTENEWYRYGRHQSLNKFDDEEKIIVGILSKGDKYAIDLNKTFIASGGTAGYCAIRLPSDSQYSIFYIQALLNSKYVEWVAMNIGDVFRGGYFAHGTSVLKRLPIMPIDFKEDVQRGLHDEIANIQKELIEITSSKSSQSKRDSIKQNRQFNSLKGKLDSCLRQLFGVSIEDDNKIPLISEYNETD